MRFNVEMDDLISTCRTCMKTDEPLLDLFSILQIENNSSIKIVDILMQTTSLQVHEKDSLPKKLCLECENFLRMAYMFRKQTLECDNKLKRLILLSTYIKHETIEDLKNEDDSDYGNYDNPLLNNDLKHTNGKRQVDETVKYENAYDMIPLNNQNIVETSCPICHLNVYDVNLHDHLNEHCQENAFIHNEARDKVLDKLDSEMKLENIDNTIKCILCPSTFSNHSNLVVHLMDHNRNKPCNSDKTDKTYLLKLSLVDQRGHFDIEGQKDKYKCIACEHSFLTERDFDQHTCGNQENNSKKTGEKAPNNFICTICGQKFEKRRSLLSHVKVHTNVDKVKVKKQKKTYICDYCKKGFTQKGGLKRHMGLHFKEKPYKCTECPKTYSRYDQFTSHMRKHSGIKPYTCDQCEKAFTQLGSLKDHIRTHSGEKPFLCAECGKGFKNQSNLRQHVKRHSGLKPFACAYCPQTFCAKGQMKAHMDTHSGVHPYVCNECGAAFTKVSSLKKHSFLHTGLKPFACDNCDMRFSCQDHLRRHRRKHTGEKPYRCSQCARAFTQCNDLRKHSRVHDGLLLYRCTVCGEKFRLMRELKLHYPTHYTGSVLETGAGGGDVAAAAGRGDVSAGEGGGDVMAGEGGGDVTVDVGEAAGGGITITIERVSGAIGDDTHVRAGC